MATDKTPEKAEELPANHVKVKVREKGAGMISRGDRDPSHQHFDSYYEEGDEVVLHIDNARALKKRDLVDFVK